MERKIILNGVPINVIWNRGVPLFVSVGIEEQKLSEDDIHTILRMINEVRRERWDERTE